MERVKALEISEHIIRELEWDIKDRRGLKWEWEKIDEAVKGEIRLAWHNIIMKELA